MPELECHADEQTRIDPITLDADHSDVSDVYRIRGGHLFITTPGEAEYLYNNVVEVEPGRFLSGHKTLLLTARTADRPEATGASRSRARYSCHPLLL